ncbi:MAG: CapA family protein [Peptococcaceae bacterium]|jgi:poly-gamma-glutamate synthesis protein (capsule biosynthesis protein)|nr:CapA family protein [Peptococcaceae bacterium]
MSKIILGLVGETNINRPRPETAFAKVQPILDRADVLFGHMESPVSDHPSENTDMPDLPFKRGWEFSKPDSVNAWKAAGFDAVGTASNVSGSAEAIVRTVEELDRLGIAHAGTGRNIEEARKPAIVEKNGAKFGFLSYTSVFYPQFVPALPKRPGAATVKAAMSIVPSWRSEEMPGAAPAVKTWLDEKEKALMLEDIAKLRRQVDYIVLSCHWGVSSDEKVQDYQTELVYAAIDAGADVIMGHHPHRPQAIQIYKGKPVFYSMGNFAFDWWFLRDSMKEGVMAYVTLENGAAAKVSFVPARREDESNDIAPLPLDSEAGIAIIETVRRLSKPFGTKLEAAGNEVVVTV